MEMERNGKNKTESEMKRGRWREGFGEGEMEMERGRWTGRRRWIEGAGEREESGRWREG